MTYIFSVRPKIFENIKPLLVEIDNYRKTIDESSDEKQVLELIGKKQEAEAQILKILKESGERYEYFDREYYEYTIVGCFEIYLEENEGIDNFKQSAAPPEWILDYWKKIEKIQKKKNLKELTLENVSEEEGFEKNPMSVIFDKWISIIKHSAENGNWYYTHVDG